ncbi:glutamine amidotransferase [Psychrobacter sp. I-STPA10]|uniref:glutamine amidotransferase n=1 Tax=Psychrobacter sp. I-STPA10 TaxID=2585769 RepID=UPI001E30C646|nr:glutamine amidotransferase [Psychrobacter sp. I-STPA10]
MKTVLVIRHIHFEDLGILEKVFKALHFNITYVEAPTVDFATLDPLADDLLVVLGAPIGAFDDALYPFLQQELDFIAKRLTANKPMLGICLGAQLFARLLGASVYPMSGKEIGFGTLQLATNIHNPLQPLQDVPVLHWHGDQFDIPEGCVCLAATQLCPNQAFMYNHHVLALQFHLEADPTKIEHWLVGHACELNTANVDIQKIRHDAQKYGNGLVIAGKKVVSNWLNSIGLC